MVLFRRISLTWLLLTPSLRSPDCLPRSWQPCRGILDLQWVVLQEYAIISGQSVAVILLGAVSQRGSAMKFSLPGAYRSHASHLDLFSLHRHTTGGAAELPLIMACSSWPYVNAAPRHPYRHRASQGPSTRLHIAHGRLICILQSLPIRVGNRSG